MSHNGIGLASATEMRRRLVSGEWTAVQVTRACLDRIDRYDGVLNAMVTLNERALDDAEALDRALAGGAEPGLLHGVPVGIKDVTPVAGLRTTYGSPLYADHVPEADALVVARLRAAGAVILGKTNTPEFATGGNTFNDVFGRTVNPWDPSRSAGGSTGGGAAALATGMIALAEGTDLGGSLRIPASFCGVTGLRPSPGLVPTWPSDYLWDTLQVTGLMARNAGDLGLGIQAVAGASPRVPVSQPTTGRDFARAAGAPTPLEGLRLAYVPDLVGIGIDPQVSRVCDEAATALSEAGARVERIDLDLSWAWQPFLALRGYWMVAHQHHRLDRLDGMGANLAGNIRQGLSGAPEALGAAEQARGRLWARFETFFRDYDALLTPCMAVPPFPVDQNYPATIGGRTMETYIDWVAPTFVLSLSGLPVASVPCGLDASGLPVGLQVLGPQFGEERVLGVAAHVEDLARVGVPDAEALLSS